MNQLAELEFDHNLFSARSKGDEKLFVTFYMGIIPDAEASAETGMRKFKDVEMIRIIVPGDKKMIVDRVVRGDDIERFGKQYQNFKDGAEQSAAGYPLKEWPLATRAMVEELRYLGFTTVEQISQASDNVMSKIPGLRELKNRADNWLKAQTAAAPMEQLQNALKTRDEQLAAMQLQIDELIKAAGKKA